MAQLNIAIEDSRKDRWKQAAKDRDRSLTSLIKTSVEAELQGGHNGGDELGDESADRIKAMSESIQAVESAVNENNRRLGSLEEQLSDDPAIRDLADEVFELLPSRERIRNKKEDFGERSIANTDSEGYPLQSERGGVVQSGRPKWIAEVVGEPQPKVLRAINLLQDETRLIGQLSVDGNTCYYKEV
jgi:hypothetical protein